MELEKIRINSSVGLAFSAFLVWIIIALNNVGNNALIIGSLVVVVVLWIALTKILFKPSRDRFLELAEELDKAKKKE